MADHGAPLASANFSRRLLVPAPPYSFPNPQNSLYRVELTPRAVLDADQAAAYIKQFDPAAASRWFDGLMEAVLTLAELPRRCPRAPEAQRLNTELRQLLYGKRRSQFRIVFRIYEEPRPVVRVVGIRHNARRELKREDLADDLGQ